MLKLISTQQSSICLHALKTYGKQLEGSIFNDHAKLFIMHGDTVYRYGNKAVDLDSLVNIASIGKLFTAYTILSHAENTGSVDAFLDRTLESFFSESDVSKMMFQYPLERGKPFTYQALDADSQHDFITNLPKISLRALLTHRSGIKREAGDRHAPFIDTSCVGIMTYSNFGYQILAKVIETCFEKPFISAVRDGLFLKDIPNQDGSLLQGADFMPFSKGSGKSYIPGADGNGCFTLSPRQLMQTFREYILPKQRMHPDRSEGFNYGCGMESYGQSFGHSGSHPGQGCFVYSPRYDHSIVMFAIYDEGQGYLRGDISDILNGHARDYPRIREREDAFHLFQSIRAVSNLDHISALIPSEGPLSMKNKGLYEDMIRELMRQHEDEKASWLKKIYSGT